MSSRRMMYIALLLLSISSLHAQVKTSRIALHDGWNIQSSCKVEAKGEVVSTPAFKAGGWYPTTVPMTVVAALVNNKVYPDPYYGMNLKSLPGMEYNVGAIFANEPMPEGSPFRCAWWYRTEFHIPLSERGKKISLHFDGINYKASIWLNGRQIATPEQVAGAYRQYEFEVSEYLKFGKANVLAVETTAQTENDLGINWVDWNPTPPDKNMGLWRDVYLTTSGPVTLRAAQVLSELDTSTFASADLTIYAELTNLSAQPVEGALEGQIGNIRISKPVQLAAGEIKQLSITPAEFKQLRIANPRVWWPVMFGKQEMYKLALAFKTGTKVSDAATVNFGIRKVTSELTPQGYRLFKINGKNLLIRGAGWASDMLQRVSAQRQEEELRYVLDMGLNTVRLEGQLETDHFYDLADQMGILVMPGWCCCSRWEEWEKWTPVDKTIATESLRSQLIRIRNHPSVFVWLNGSDNPPVPEIEQTYLDVEKELHWPNPVLSSATAKSTTVTGQSGVKMSGPYEYVPPVYWYSDVEKKYGGGYGFNTETSPGPAPPVEESIRRMIPKEHWWPIDDVWAYHAGSGSFKDINIFTAAMEARYGAAKDLPDFSLRSQVMTYDNERAMFESYSRNKYTSTGVIQWMLNNAWPGMIWHLYDYYLVPGGGYFGTKKANEPVHVLYGYDDKAVWVVNNLLTPVSDAKIHVSVMNLDATEKFAKDASIDIAADSSTRVMAVPEIDGVSPTYFVNMELRDSAGKLLSSNFYWLSTTPETFDWTKTNYFVTPVVQHADLKAMNELPKVKLETTAHSTRSGRESIASVIVRNPTKSIAFAVELKLKNVKGEMIAPVFWEDNYFPLLPGEKRTVSVRYAEQPSSEHPTIQVGGWNVERAIVRPLGGATTAKKESETK